MKTQTESEYTVVLTFQYPSTQYRGGVRFTFYASNKAQAIRYARRQADADGHLGLKMGRATFRVESTY